MSWKNRFIFCIFILLNGLALTIQAKPIEKTIVVAPHCLIKQMTRPYTILAANQTLSLIAITQKDIRQLIQLKSHQKEVCGGFIDVTDEWNKFNAKSLQQTKLFLKQYDMPVRTSLQSTNYSIRYETQVNQLLSQIN